jgi:GNAT superfamily N-acetyltransferase
MVHRLDRIPKMPAPFPIERVVTQDLADRLAVVTKKRPMPCEYFLPDSLVRAYVALDAGKPIGWTQSIAVGKSNWVAGMHVLPKYRRRGIAKSMLARMLRDDRASGSTGSVLLASHTGALLYPHVGYELIGTLLLYTPSKR